MGERPILFSAPMVRAILEGRKTQTRRAIKAWPSGGFVQPLSDGSWEWSPDGGFDHGVINARPRYGKSGDVLWVRETWAEVEDEYGSSLMLYRAGGHRIIGATGSRHAPVYSTFDGDPGSYEQPEKWRPSIFMPRWACRIRLELVADVRPQPLQDITPSDSMSEGVDGKGPNKDIVPHLGWRMAYAALWDRINGFGAWERNPWVWCVEFRMTARPSPAAVVEEK